MTDLTLPDGLEKIITAHQVETVGHPGPTKDPPQDHTKTLGAPITGPPAAEIIPKAELITVTGVKAPSTPTGPIRTTSDLGPLMIRGTSPRTIPIPIILTTTKNQKGIRPVLPRPLHLDPLAKTMEDQETDLKTPTKMGTTRATATHPEVPAIPEMASEGELTTKIGAAAGTM